MLRLFLGKDVSTPEIVEYSLRACGLTDFEILRKKNGKPFLKGNPLFFNVSHSGPYIICAVSDKEVGIDLEENTFRPRVLKRYFTEAEQKYIGNSPERFTEIWTLKEAHAKYTGNGINEIIH